MNIRHYAIIQEHSPEKLVVSVTEAVKQGYQPVGGVSVAFEPAAVEVPMLGADRKAKAAKPRMILTQALVRLWTANDALGQIVTSAPRINGA